MKTQNTNKLVFKKESVTELNDHQLNDVNGGFPSILTILSSVPCGITVSVAASVAVIIYTAQD